MFTAFRDMFWELAASRSLFLGLEEGVGLRSVQLKPISRWGSIPGQHMLSTNDVKSGTGTVPRAGNYTQKDNKKNIKTFLVKYS